MKLKFPHPFKRDKTIPDREARQEIEVPEEERGFVKWVERLHNAPSNISNRPPRNAKRNTGKGRHRA